MSKYQIIFTSCKRGINGTNEGLQVYSHSLNIIGNVNDYAKNLLPYHPPALPQGEAMTEEKAKTMPRSFVYRQLPNQASAIVLKTYLGREQLEPKGILENYISHGIIMEEGELKDYPAEYFGSGMFKTRMEPEEANSPVSPPFLPRPELIKGQKVNLENIITFLSTDNRIGIFKKMLAAMLAYKTARKPVVICDSPGNTIMWIAALHYALPLETALTVNFSTYEQDPSRSGSQICGVIPGAYIPAKGHWVFDLSGRTFPDIEAEGSFFDFISTGFASSYESIQDFHKFVMEKLTYRSIDEEYCSAYSLYALFKNGIANLPYEDFKGAVSTADKYGTNDVKMEVLVKIFADRKFVLTTHDDYALEIFKALLNKYPMVDPATQDYIRGMVGEKVIASFVSPKANKDSFEEIYAQLEAMCHGFDIPAILMKDANIKPLMATAKRDPEQWRWDFMIDMICDYVQTQDIPVEHLSLEHKTGQLIGDIVSTRLEAGPNSGFALITRMLARFSEDWNYLANLALNLEGVILDSPDSETLVYKHWAHVYDMFASYQSTNRQHIYKLFLLIDREDQVFDMYCVFMGKAAHAKTANELFQEQVGLKYGQYLQEYLLRIYEQYYGYLKTRKESAASAAKRELLKQIAQENISTDFANELVGEILDEIPFGALSKDNEKLVSTLLDYFRGQRAENMPKRLVLLASGMLLGNVRSAYELENAVGTARRIASSETIILDGLTGAEADKYISWVAPALFSCSKSSEELVKSFEIFKHSKASSGSFITVCAKEALRGSKGDYGSMMVFLGFLFRVGSVDDRQEVGRVFCKLKTQKLEALNEAVQEKFQEDKKYLFYWSEVHEVAAKTNPILNSIGNLFRRKK